MARTKEYRHYCPAARTLEVVGEKWSLLIVRDLLLGPQRFTDLLHSLGGITAKWLTLRLRDLETAGVVARDQEPGRREVRYALTPKGWDLLPVVEGLIGWGLAHGPAPAPGEAIHPRRAVGSAMALLNRRGARPDRATTWVVALAPGQADALRFDGQRWEVRWGDADGDLRVETTPEVWATFLAAPPAARRHLLAGIRIDGDPALAAEFAAAFGVTAPTAA